MATVYVVNKGGHDYKPAEKFGRLHFLSEGSVSKFAVNKIYRDFAMHLRSSGPDDYILITGLSTMNVVACSCFSFLHGRLNILLYKNGRYTERKLVLSDLLSRGGKSVEKQVEDLTNSYKEEEL